MLTENLSVGILAHVDAGKTTLSEGIMFKSGQIRSLGRVDHRDAFLDTDVQERERKITIFSKQAIFHWKNRKITLMDTPGHVDFSAETERVLPVLDAAVLVISGADGVQGHTVTLWRLLKKYGVPVFVFVNKMDQPGTDRQRILEELKRYLGDGFIDTAQADEQEEIALHDEEALNEYLSNGCVSLPVIQRLVSGRKVFPVYFGAALKLLGIEQLLDGICDYMPPISYPDIFSARVFKIGRDPQGARLTYAKITGGSVKVRALLSGAMREREEGGQWQEKISQIRMYSGAKFTSAEEAFSGDVCAFTGLNYTKCMDVLGEGAQAVRPELEPVFSYRVLLQPDQDVHTALSKFRMIEEEDPLLRVQWNERLGEIHVQLMGEVQLEVLRRLMRDRFQMQVDFGEGGIMYKETIRTAVEGAGHYEPLRHYAEVHLLLEPGERGSGIRIMSKCPEDELDRNWQRLIFTHLLEKTYIGVLTGSPITDITISIIAGRAHLKHTEGGDFRQATYRAVRQGLMQAENVLLEPWYDVRLTVPEDCVGRAISDLTQMGASFSAPELIGAEAMITGRVPVRKARFYAKEVQTYTRGRGKISVSVRGYEPVEDAEKIIAAIGYDPERDVENTADSVFCSHGAGVVVKWNEAAAHMHIQTNIFGKSAANREESAVKKKSTANVSDEELKRIFERTYGQIKPSDFRASSPRKEAETVKVEIVPRRPEYLLVDGYNILHAWEETRQEAQRDLESARRMLMDILANYQGFTSKHVILVFDAYKVAGGVGSVQKYNGIDVVYTKEAETADSYIEKATYEISRQNDVRVATSDGLEQLIIFGNGAMRISANEFKKELENTNAEIRRMIERKNAPVRAYKVQAALSEAARKAEREKGKSIK